ncbi:MAG: hypothetical protein ACLU80_14925 [Dorea sp.]
MDSHCKEQNHQQNRLSSIAPHNKVLAGFNDLATLFPEVANEMSAVKNEKETYRSYEGCKQQA